MQTLLFSGSPSDAGKHSAVSKDAIDGLLAKVIDGTDTLINFDNDNELSSSSFSSSYSGDLLHFQNASDDLI
jgi:hypothetical protein